jgi:RNA polymerase sigma factor (sigma-70 family)
MDFGKVPLPGKDPAGSGAARLDGEFRRFGFLVYRVALGILRNREEAEDVVLDVFALKAGAFLESRPDIPAAEFGYWLRRVAKNLALDRLRSRKRACESLEAAALAAPAAEETQDEAASPARYLSLLDRTDREIVQGKYGLGLPWEEVSRRAGVTLAQARYRAQKALARLRKIATKEAGYALGWDR